MLTDEAEIAAALATRERTGFRYYSPLSTSVESYTAWAATPEQRVYTGIEQLDERMRGTAPGELTLIIGFSAGGKTLLATKLLQVNPHKRIALFSPDETRDLILVKLTCADNGITALDLEQRLQADDPTARQQLHETAARYANLAVYEDGLLLHEMDAALDELEAQLWFGGKCDAVIYDYLELLEGGGEDARGKASALKAWGKRRHVPLFVLHQTSRSAGKDGARPGLASGAYGGEQQSTHVIGVWRRKYEIMAQLRDIDEKLANPLTKSIEALERARDDMEYLLKRHQYTVSVNLVKTKRPGSQIDDDGWDMELDVGSGAVFSMDRGDLPTQFRIKPKAVAFAEQQGLF